MTNKKEKFVCNCFIGWLNGYENNWELSKSDYIEQCLLYRSDINIKKLMNSGMARKFTFCPNCGEKINWKDLLSPNLKEDEES